MKKQTYIIGSKPFDQWLTKHPGVETLTLEGVLRTEELYDFDEQLFKSPIKTIEIGDITLIDEDEQEISPEDYAATFLEEEEMLPKLLKILCNTQYSSVYSLSEDMILSPDGEILIHIEDACEIPKEVKIIGNYACHLQFVGEFDFPNGLREIGAHAFESCDCDSSVKLPDTVVALGESAFSNCYLTRLTLSNNLKEIPANCFSRNFIKSLKLPQSIKAIRRGAFDENLLSKITFNKGLEIIEGDAFDSLSFIKLPSSVKEIAKDFYYDSECQKPEGQVPYIEVAKTNPYFEASNGNLYRKGSDELYLEVPFCCRTKHYLDIPKKVIPANVQPKSVILKWNPSFSSFQISSYLSLLQHFAYKGKDEGRYDSMNWSVWDYDKINVADRVYWLKVGYGQIGIVGSGVVTSDPYLGEDWSGQGRTTYYVDFIPDVLLNPDAVPILTCDELQRAIPDFEWTKGHSGLVLNDEQAQKLDSLWKEFLQRNEDLFKKKMEKEGNEQVYIKAFQKLTE